MSRDRYFPSRRDRWAAVMFWAIALSLWTAGLWVWTAGASLEAFIVADLIGFLSGCLVLWFWCATGYRITGSELQIRSGPLRTTIPLRKIRGVITSRKGWGMSYALSLQSIQIDVEGAKLGYRISPKDREGFMGMIAERCEWLEWQGGDLINPNAMPSR